MREWTCRCGARNPKSARACENCGVEIAPTKIAPIRRCEADGSPLGDDGFCTNAEHRYCTKEENDAAMRIVKDVLFKRITEAEGQRRLAALFPELIPNWSAGAPRT